MLAWCTVHRRTYKPLRSRLEDGLGSTPSASTIRSKLIRMSRRFLIVGQLVRFQPDAPSLRNCGRMVRRSTFNRDGESSILSSSTNVTICRRRLVARIADLQSADGSSILLAGATRPVRPRDQDRCATNASPERETRFRSGGRAAKAPHCL